MDVVFHLHIPPAWPQRCRYLCRLLAKAYAAQARVWVVVAAEEVQLLDEALWTVTPEDFVPHVCAHAPDLLCRHAPIVIATPQDPVRGQRDVLVNAQPGWPEVLDSCQSFKRVIEIVAAHESDKAAARQRWRRYQAMGWRPQAHDFAQRGAAAASQGDGA